MVKNYFLHKVVPFLIFYHILENATALGEQKVGSMYVDGFVLRQFIEHHPTGRAHLHSPNAVAFSSFQLFPNVPFDPQ